MNQLFRKITAIAAFLFLAPTAVAQMNFDAVQIEAIPVADNIYMLTGAGGNMGLIVGEDGAFLIDDQFAPLTEKITAAIAELTDQPIRFVINTHYHGDHTGGNENLGKAGALIVAHDNVYQRMSAEEFMEDSETPKEALPVVTFTEDVNFYINDEHVHGFHIGDAHTDGDTIIHFKNANVVHMGDIYFSGLFPYIDVDAGGSIDGIITAVNRVLAISNEDTKIIPGHGPLSSMDDLKGYRSFLTKLRSKVFQLISEGKTLEQIQEANPTEGYEEWNWEFISSNRIVESVYKDLSGSVN